MAALPTLLTIPPPPGNAVELGPLTIHYYALAIITGVVLGVLLARRRWAARGGDPELVVNVATYALLAGLLGARLGYVSTNLDRFVDRPYAVLFIHEGGLVFFGGLLLGGATVLWFLRRQGVDIPAFVDAAVPAVPLAHAVGRWGNYFNQELYGTPTDLPWALEIERAQRVAPYQAFETFHPTFLYESLFNLALVVVLLWLGSRRRLTQGSLLFVYLIGYGSARFALELIRTDTTFRVLGISRNGYMAALAVVVGVVALRWWQSRGPVPLAGEASRAAHEGEQQPDAADHDE